MPTGPVEEAPEVQIASTSWWSVDPGLFKSIQDQLLDDWAEELGIERSKLPITKAEVGDILKEYISDNWTGTDGPTDYPHVRDDPEIWTRLSRHVTGADLLPDRFRVMHEAGTTTLYRNDPTDLKPVAIPDESSDSRYDVGFQSNESQRDVGVPIISGADLEAASTVELDDGPTGPGRGRLAFDRAAVDEDVKNMWGRILWEDPPPGLTDEYINSTNQLYQASGTQQGLQPWLLSKIRQTPKYGVMYGRMEPGVSELEWQQRFNTSQFGLRLEDERAQSIRGMSSGAAPASFQQSVEQSRDVQAVGQGRFSQRFANHIAQLGPLQKA